MKKYIIAAATIMAINNSPTFAQGKVTTGHALASKANYPDQPTELSSANEKEQVPEITQAQGGERGRTERPFEQGLNAVDEQEADRWNEKFRL